MIDVLAEKLEDGMVICLPFGRTATIAGKPKVGRKFVTFKTQHGKSRLLIGEPVLVEEK